MLERWRALTEMTLPAASQQDIDVFIITHFKNEYQVGLFRHASITFAGIFPDVECLLIRR